MSDVKLSSLAPDAGRLPERATFYGVHDRDITANNQVAIPKSLKRVLDDAREEKLLLVHWQNEQFLRLYTKNQFDQKIDEVKKNLEIPVEQRAAAVRKIAAAAVPIEPDSQGRFVLPLKWLTALGFKDKVVFRGVHTYIEVCPAQVQRADEEVEQKELGPLLTRILDM